MNSADTKNFETIRTVAAEHGLTIRGIHAAMKAHRAYRNGQITRHAFGMALVETGRQYGGKPSQIQAALADIWDRLTVAA